MGHPDLSGRTGGQIKGIAPACPRQVAVRSTEELLRRILLCADRACSDSFADEVISCVTTTVREMLGAASAALVLLDRESDYLAIHGAEGLSRKFTQGYRRTVGTGIVGEIIWNDRQVFLDGPDPPSDPPSDPESLGTRGESDDYLDLKMERDSRSLMCVRIATDGRPMGFLWADAEATGQFRPEDLVTLRLLADLAALAAERDRVRAAARQQASTTDGPARVYSYSYFHRRLTEEIERSQRLNERISLLLVAADGTEEPSATLDRPRTGDGLLGELASQVTDATRTIDVIGRYGASQLALYMPETSQDAAMKAAERIRQMVERAGGATEGDDGSDRPATTVSIGVATLPENGQTVDQLMNALASALFKAQRAGRNRVSGPAEMYVI